MRLRSASAVFPALAVPAILAILALASCTPRAERPARPPLTERQRDSVLARSALPGAPVVGRALEVSDRAADHAAGLATADSLFLGSSHNSVITARSQPTDCRADCSAGRS